MQNYPDKSSRGRQRIITFLNNAKRAPVWLTLLLGAIGSLPLVLLTPPFQVNDEVQHFYRAYELSEFHIRAEVQNGISGATIPDSLPELVRSFDYAAHGLPLTVGPAPLAKTLELASIPLQSSKRHFVAFPGSAFYSPLPYLPQILGIAIGRLLGFGPLYLFYIGRLFNCLTVLGLLGLAVYWMPVASELVMIVGLLPMSLFQYASVSPDAVMLGCAFVFTALALSAMMAGKWKTWELLTAAIAGAVFCSIKPPYAPLLMAGLIPGLFQRDKVAGVLRTHLILLTSALGVAIAWLLFTRSIMTTTSGTGHPSVQLNLVLHQPMIAVHAFSHTLGLIYLAGLYLETVGIFGWMSVLMQPNLFYLMPFASAVIAWRLGSRGKDQRSISSALWHFAITLVASFLVMFAMYLMNSHPGQNLILGVQGRYFLPVLVLAGMAVIELFPMSRPPKTRWPEIVTLSIIILAQIAAMDATIIGAFHVL